MKISDDHSINELINCLTNSFLSNPSNVIRQLNEIFSNVIKIDHLQRKEEKVRMRAMQILKHVVFPFVLE